MRERHHERQLGTHASTRRRAASRARGVPPFEFRKALALIEATTLRAASPAQLLTGVTLARDRSIFFHLHRFFYVEPEILPEYPNDFAQWVGVELGNGPLAERLANVNLFRTEGMRAVRRELGVILADHLTREGDGPPASPARAFIFCQPRMVIVPCGRDAATPEEFVQVIREIESEAIAFHLFAPKARYARGRTDFAAWFESWGYTRLAQQLDSFDPYLNSLEDTRTYLVETVAAGLAAKPDADA